MKFFILLGFTSLAATAAGLPGWRLVWSDEFEKPGQPAPAKWSYEKGLIRNGEKQFYTDNRRENARVEDGKLIIEAKKEKMHGGEFTSASLTSQGHADWTYGRLEVSAKLPAARGTWPAIWMLPSDHGKIPWPKCGDIDIMEQVGYDPDTIHGTLHTEAFNHLKNTQRTSARQCPRRAAGFTTTPSIGPRIASSCTSTAKLTRHSTKNRATRSRSGRSASRSISSSISPSAAVGAAGKESTTRRFPSGSRWIA